jgi:hypothetical protein
MDCVCEGWGEGVAKDIRSIKLSHLTYVLLNMHFDITLGFANIKTVASS